MVRVHSTLVRLFPRECLFRRFRAVVIAPDVSTSSICEVDEGAGDAVGEVERATFWKLGRGPIFHQVRAVNSTIKAAMHSARASEWDQASGMTGFSMRCGEPVITA